MPGATEGKYVGLGRVCKEIREKAQLNVDGGVHGHLGMEGNSTGRFSNRKADTPCPRISPNLKPALETFLSTLFYPLEEPCGAAVGSIVKRAAM